VFVPPWLWDEWYERKNWFRTAVSQLVEVGLQADVLDCAFGVFR
jgi:hypothetical protein